MNLFANMSGPLHHGYEVQTPTLVPLLRKVAMEFPVLYWFGCRFVHGRALFEMNATLHPGSCMQLASQLVLHTLLLLLPGAAHTGHGALGLPLPVLSH